MFSKKVSILVFLMFCFNYGDAYRIQLDCAGPIVQGATLNCTTLVFEDDGKTLAVDTVFRYQWEDNGIPQHSKEVKTGPKDTWNVSYSDVSSYRPGKYIIRVTVCQWKWFFCGSSDISTGTFFHITDTLNGELVIHQANQTRDAFVSTIGVAKININLKQSDKDLLSKAPTVLSYWFVDCVYYGIATDLDFDYNFTKPEESHIIEALVVGDFTPLPPPTTTTTPPTTTTTAKPNTTTKATTTTQKPTAVTTVKPSSSRPSSKSKREVSTPLPVSTPAPKNGTQSNIKIWQNGTLVPYNRTFPYVCNSTVVTTDKAKVYGYFHKTVKAIAPVANVTVSGNNWLQHGDLMALRVKCQGSQSLQYCVKFIPGVYNVTGNETCGRYDSLDICDFGIQRYFHESNKHTVLIILKNEVSIKVTSVAITIYKAKQQAQLSVIVVPVAFSLVAVVTIVFGFAYYFQNRSRFVVEVADFDFGQQYADMEYKTFRDRLKDSITNAFTRDPLPTSSSDAPIWPPGHKYGSMT